MQTPLSPNAVAAPWPTHTATLRAAFRAARWCCTVSIIAGLTACTPPPANALPWALTVVDAEGPSEPWGKAVGDVNGDGSPDLVVGGHQTKQAPLWRRALNKVGLFSNEGFSRGQLVWYESPFMKKHLVSDQFDVRTDIKLADVDGDGQIDLIALTDQGVVWFKGPHWAATRIDDRVLHDIELADLDGDGDLDMLARDQRRSGDKGGNLLHMYRQQPGGVWSHEERPIAPGEGLEVADMDQDGWPDAVVNQSWIRNTGGNKPVADWTSQAYCSDWNWPDARLAVHDMNLDGRPDVVMAPAEPGGSDYRLSWCQAPATDQGAWTEHVLLKQAETLIHSLVVGDFNHDGLPDVVTAHMHQSRTPEIALFTQAPDGRAWTRTVLGMGGSHNMLALDHDQDGDLDLMGANWSGDDQVVKLWVNPSTERTAIGWQRHVIDAAKPWTSVFVKTVDLNGDGLKDIVTGGWWYQNPGAVAKTWTRHRVGEDANNVALVIDIDGDGDPDLVSSTWADENPPTIFERLLRKTGLHSVRASASGNIVWAENDGQGRFLVHHNLAPGNGDFLQGAALLQSGDARRVALSWHAPGRGVQQWHIPQDPARDEWPVTLLTPHSQDEALTAADLDGDGRQDLLLGTHWLQNETDGVWRDHLLHAGAGNPDRNRVADLDGDGRLDAVVGYEAIDTAGQLAWYSSNPDPTKPWNEHRIAELFGPMSLDLADLDGDGDTDVVVGEHKLRHPATARLVWFENRFGDARHWVVHTVHTGDEHHDGAQVIDIDNDGDLDIVSIGWSHPRVLLYENLAK